MDNQDTHEIDGARGLLFKRIINRLGRPFGINPFPRAFANPAVNVEKTRKGVFEHVFKTNYWGAQESRSGVGSGHNFTAGYRRSLNALITEKKFGTLFDAPCGDLNWMSTIVSEGEFDYIGGDISPSVVENVKQRFPDLNVRLFDICEDEFPSADVWHCRDCLFHLPFDDIHHALSNFTRSKIPYALITTHRSRWHRNLDVPIGGFRYLDLEREPINLPPAEQYLTDYIPWKEFPRLVGLWSREAIARAIQNGK